MALWAIINSKLYICQTRRYPNTSEGSVAISTAQFSCSNLLFTNRLLVNKGSINDNQIQIFSICSQYVYRHIFFAWTSKKVTSIKASLSQLMNRSLGEHNKIKHLHKHYILCSNIIHVWMDMHGVSDSCKLFHSCYNIWLRDKMSCLCIFCLYVFWYVHQTIDIPYKQLSSVLHTLSIFVANKNFEKMMSISWQ